MTNIFRLNGHTLQDVAKCTCSFLEFDENMETQCLTSLDNQVFIQGRAKYSNIKKLVGMDKAISIKLNPIGDDYFSIEIGEGKWADKGVALAAAWFVFWPFAVTSGIGIYKQKTLPAKILRELATVFTPECQLD